LVVEHCPLPAKLQSIVAAYTATTAEDMWADGLRIRAPKAQAAASDSCGGGRESASPSECRAKGGKYALALSSALNSMP
jgi:hypothetical protein